MFTERIVTLAQKVVSKEILPDEVPVYDRNLVQECLLGDWLKKDKKCFSSNKAPHGQVFNT